jgi:hypothetical protein
MYEVRIMIGSQEEELGKRKNLLKNKYRYVMSISSSCVLKVRVGPSWVENTVVHCNLCVV